MTSMYYKLVFRVMRVCVYKPNSAFFNEEKSRKIFLFNHIQRYCEL